MNDDAYDMNTCTSTANNVAPFVLLRQTINWNVLRSCTLTTFSENKRKWIITRFHNSYYLFFWSSVLNEDIYTDSSLKKKNVKYDSKISDWL